MSSGSILHGLMVVDVVVVVVDWLDVLGVVDGGHGSGDGGHGWMVVDMVGWWWTWLDGGGCGWMVVDVVGDGWWAGALRKSDKKKTLKKKHTLAQTMHLERHCLCPENIPQMMC